MDEITTVEAKERAAVPLSTVHRWLVSGKIPFRWAGRQRVIRTADLDAFLAARAAFRGDA